MEDQWNEWTILCIVGLGLRLTDFDRIVSRTDHHQSRFGLLFVSRETVQEDLLYKFALLTIVHLTYRTFPLPEHF